MAIRAGQTRKRIIEAAYRMFYRDGFFRSGVDAIAEAAHVTKRTLYYLCLLKTSSSTFRNTLTSLGQQKAA
jgi:Bacterial regulatory proteins, tetR family